MSTEVLDDLWKVTYNWTLAGGEIAANHVWVTVATGGTSGDVLGGAEALIDAFWEADESGAGFDPLSLAFPDELQMVSITCRPYVIATGLPSALPVTSEHPLVGGGTGGSLPYQCSAVVSFRNVRTIGRRTYNRTFLPPFAKTAIAAAGQMTTGMATAITDAWAMGVAAAAAVVPAVSQVYYGSVGHDVLGLDRVECDTVIDTQRRRRNALVGGVEATTL